MTPRGVVASDGDSGIEEWVNNQEQCDEGRKGDSEPRKRRETS